MTPNGAILSPCETYRYALWRTLDGMSEGKIIGYLGVNPSTADHKIDDQTVMKWRGFTKILGGHKFVVGNPFGARATDVKELKTFNDPIGPDNDKWIDILVSRCDIIIPCWGNSSKVPKELRYRFADIEAKLRASGKELYCFGRTNSGDPKHPLMLGYNTEIERY